MLGSGTNSTGRECALTVSDPQQGQCTAVLMCSDSMELSKLLRSEAIAATTLLQSPLAGPGSCHGSVCQGPAALGAGTPGRAQKCRGDKCWGDSEMGMCSQPGQRSSSLQERRPRAGQGWQGQRHPGLCPLGSGTASGSPTLSIEGLHFGSPSPSLRRLAGVAVL